METRREFLKASALGAAAALAGRNFARAGAGERPRPNIVYIMADDLGYGELGCYGQRLIRTPHLDRMAAEGMRFTDFYAGTSLCIPARSCLMTGLHAGHTLHGGRNGHVPLRDEDVTVAEMLRAAGYHAACIGKWALGDKPDGTGTPPRQGWDYYFGEPHQTLVHSYYLPHVWECDRDGSVTGKAPDAGMRQVPIPENAGGQRLVYSHDLLAERALAYLGSRRGKAQPFFLYVPFTIPHADYDVPSQAPYEKEAWPERARILAAMITRMDTDIGRLFDRLKQLGMDENTVVFFASDNGSPLGGDEFRRNGPLRATKGQMYEGGIRVPFIARWPGKVKPGTTCREPLAFYDFAPTALDLAGAAPPARTDGLSFVPALTGRPQPSHEFVYCRTGGQALRAGDWKLVEPKPNVRELYNLADDLSEKKNVAAENPEIVERLGRLMDAAGGGAAAAPPAMGPRR